MQRWLQAVWNRILAPDDAAPRAAPAMRPRRQLELYDLEERILFNATPLGVEAVLTAAEPIAPLEPVAAESSTDATIAVANAPAAADAALPSSNDDVSAPASSETATQREIVFVDASLPDYDDQVQAILDRDTTPRELTVVVLDGNQDGIEQISAVLGQHRELEAVHFLSHGADGEFKLGGTHLSADNLAGYAGQIARWADSLAADAELVFHDGDLLTDVRGQELIEALGALTHANVESDTDGKGAVSSQRSGVYDVVLIDSQLQDSQLLADSVAAGSRVFVYDGLTTSAHDLLTQVSVWADTTGSRIQSLSILSHGTAGAFELGNQWITTASLEQYAADWRQLSQAFTADAAIDLFSCDVAAQGSDGQLLIDQLSRLTEATVYASTNITGRGGDWFLEASSAGTPWETNASGPFDMERLEMSGATLAWYNASWQYRQVVTIDKAMVTGTSDLTNFAVLVSVTDLNLRSTGNGGLVGQTDGGDFVFTSADGATKLDHEIESYDATTGTLKVWVEAPVLSYNSNTQLYLYYGNAAAANQWNASGTWNSSAAGVWHLGADYNDSTANANNGVNTNSTNDAGAKIGAGDAFNGTNAKQTVADSNSLDIISALTVSGWIKASNLSGYHSILQKGVTTTSVNYYVDTSGTDLDFGYYNGSLQEFTSSGAGLTTGQWFHFAVTYNDASNTIKMYVNGSQVYSTTSATTAMVANNGAMTIGNNAWNEWFSGSLDEIRVESTAQSSDWIKTEYNNQNAPGTYVTLNAEPVVTTTGSALAYTENAAAAAIDTGVTVSDLNNANLTGAAVTISAGFVNGEDVLAFSNQLGITGSWNSSTGVMTLSGTTTAANYQTALRAVTYVNTSDNPNTSTRTVTFVADDGSADSIAAARNITITAVNDVPVRTAGTPAAVSVNEDSANTTAVTLGLGSLAYAPGGGETTQTLTYKVTSIPAVMTLWLADGTTQVTANTTVSLAQLQGLKYKTLANSNGSGSLTWTVQDNGGTANGGVDTLTETLSVTVGAVNDVPVRTAGSPAAISVNEDSANTTAVTLGMSALTYGVGGGSDESGQTLIYKVTVIPACMTLWLADGATQVTANTTVSLAQLQGLKYKTVADTVGSGSLTWTVQDSGGTANGGVDTLTETLSVTVGAVNDVPVRTAGSPAAISVNEDSANATAVTLGMSALTYGVGGGSDESGQTLTYKVTVIPTCMTLWLADGTTQVTGNTTVSLAQLQGLKYKTIADTVGSGSLTWTVQDSGGTANGGVDTLTETLSVTVGAVNDVPVRTAGSPAAISANEDSANATAVTLGMSALTYGVGGGSDESGQTLTYKVTVIPACMTLWLADGTTQVTADTTVSLAQLQGLKYKTIADTVGSGSLTWTVQDSGGTANGGVDTLTETLSVTVGAVNDVPVRTAGSPAAISVNEDSANTTAVTLGMSALTYGVGGGSDEAAQTLTYKVTVIPACMTLWLADGTTQVTANTTVSLAQLQGLKYKTLADTVGSGSLTWTVQDSGGTVNGGVDTLTETLSVTVGAVNDVPVRTAGSPAAISVNEDNANATAVTLGMSALTYGVGGGSDESGQTLTYKVTVIPTCMTLWLADGTTQVTANTTVSLAQLQGLKYKTIADTVGSGSLTWAVQDSGGTANGGVDTLTETLSVTVGAVNDVPVRTAGSPAAISVNEDSANATAVTLGMSAMTYGVGGGSDESGQTLTYKVTVIPACMTLWLADGTTQVTANTTVSVAQLQGLKYKTLADTVGSGSLTWTVQDSGGTANGGVDTLTETLSVTVGAVNDVPVRTAGSPAAISVNEDSANATAVTLGMSALTYGVGGGGDESGQTLTYKVTVIPACMTLWLADGTTQVTANTTVSLAQLQGLKYKTIADTVGSGSLTWTVQDSGGTANGGGDTLTENLAISVNAINDAPVITSNGSGASASVTIAENIDFVTTVTSTDIDGGTAIYSILGGADAALFAIDSSTGALAFISAVDFDIPSDWDTNNVYDLIVQVSDGNGGTDTQAISVTITDVDEFVVSALADADGAANGVAENAANGTAVGLTAFAADADATTNTIVYTLTDDAGGRFAIDGTTGLVTVADGSLLDREAAASYAVTVRATSADGSTADASFTINLTDVDEFDVSAMSDANGAANGVAENAASGTAVGLTALAADADATTNTIVYTLTDDAGGRFAINGTTGLVTVADGSLLDRETAASYTVTVRATSADGSTADASFTINLSDVDEFDVSAFADADGAANGVAENAANGTAVGLTAFAADADATTNTIVYTLTDDAGGRFAIDGTTGLVTVADGSLLDRETAASYAVTVRATSADGSTADASFTISLTDVDEFDVSPVGDANGAANGVAENAANGTAVGLTAFAADADATTNTIVYTLTDDAGGRFAINGTTGLVTVADGSLLDRETAASYTVTVRATSADGSTADASFTINLTDVDEFDVSAMSDANGAANGVAENAANGTAVGLTAFAADTDATANTIVYTLTDDAGGRFAINGTTGLVTVADGSLLDRETAASYTVTVRATSADGSTADATFTINLSDVDEFDVSPVGDANGAANGVAENAANGTAVGLTAFAADADATTNTIVYTLTDDAGGRFAINGTTGLVTVADGSLLDREAAASYAVTVRATSADGSTADASFTINLTDVDEFDVSAPADANGAANGVAENAASGTAVGLTAFAADADATTNTIVYTLTDDAGGRFAINGTTGLVTVADGSLLDRETAASYAVTVRATSADGSTADATFTINLSDVDEFDVSALADADGAANGVAENAANGTAVGLTAFAADADATANTIVYTLTDDAGGRFAINGTTGLVTVADGSLLDRETAASYTVTVRATSADGSTADASFTINLSDVDEFDVSPVGDANGAANSVAENAANGTAVGLTAFAADADATTNTIVYTLTDDAGGRFAIDGTTGLVTVADGSLLDRETAASYAVTVRATSADGSTADASFTISLTDVDEFDVSPVGDANGAANGVAENAANGTAVGLTAFAADADATTNTIVYTLTDDAGGRFAINGTTGLVTVADGSLLDRETAASYTVTVRATSADGSTADATFTINLSDVDEFDVSAMSDANGAANGVAENAANGTAVGLTAFAADTDATANTIVYTLTDDAGGRFAINGTTGLVTVADGSLLDREAAASYAVTVRATSADGSTADASFTINLTDVDEFDVSAPADANGAANGVAENAASGTAVGLTAFAADADATTNTIVYTLTDDAGGRFAINGTTGLVTVADGSLLDRETAASYAVTVRATSADGSTADATFTINLSDVDEFDVSALADADGAANGVAENAANGTAVGLTAFAADADATTNTIVYTLTDDAGGRFAIDGTTGLVTVADGSLLDRETAASYAVTVRATSADGSTADASFTINLTDVDEFDVAAMSDVNGAANGVAENAANGTAVGLTALAADADATTNTIVYTLTDDAGGRFAIDGTTGLVTVADGSLLDREAAASYAVTVRATSADGSTADASFTINLTDVDEFDVSPVGDANGAANSVAENAANGTAVGLTALAADADATANTIVYTLTDNAGGRFAIDGTTGLVTVADGSLLDREAAASYAVTVRATSADGSTADATFTINLTDVDEFDVAAMSDANGAANGVAENAANGTAVGLTAFAADADATTNTIVYTLTDDAGGRFAIDGTTGLVTVADGSLLDREAAASYAVTVRATSADGSMADATFTISLTDVDEFDVSAMSDANGAANGVAENAASGTAVGLTAFAADADATTNTIVYTLTDDAGGRFAIDGTTGLVTVADGSLLDREAAASYAVTVRATSADGSTADASFTISLTDVDEFDVSAMSDANGAANGVAENAANGTAVGLTAFAADADATANTIVYTLTDDAGGRFAINGTTGLVTVADGSLLDRETAASYTVTVRATSADGSTADASFTINLTDVDEFDVSAPADANGATNGVAENAASGTAVGLTAFAADTDATTNTIVYTLTDDAGGRFAINGTTGLVTVADGSLLDRETAASYTVTVRATSADGSTADATFTINLSDVDEFDVSPVGDANGAANGVAENAANGTAVGLTAFAADADATTNTIVYTLTDDAGGRFAINGTTGLVTVADGSLLDREAAASYAVTVRATSADGSTADASFTINLTDVDEFDVSAPADANGATNGVAENAANGTAVGLTALAADADATTNTIVYTLTDDAGGRFAIDGTTGLVTVADGSLLDRETAASYAVTVRATSADGSTADATFTINLSDVDEFDVSPVGDANGAANGVAENAANGTVVGLTALAADADATTNTIVYTLTDDAGGRFAINGTTGLVTVADGSLLDRETAASYTVTVRATSADGSTADASFTINLSDVDEFDVSPVGDANGAANSVAENAANGTAVGLTALAADADATTNTIVYTLTDDAGGRFAIDGTTGLVTVADGSLLDRETAASYTVTVRATSADGSTADATFTINLTDVDEFDVSAPADANGATNGVAENAANGTAVGLTALAADADATTNTIVYTLTDDAGGRFAIDGTTGLVTVADGSLLDRETAASYAVTVRATSADGSTADATFTINLSDVDEFDVSPVGDANVAANGVAENSANGTVVGLTAFAADADATTNTIVYTLTDDAGGRFAIDGTTGLVTVADGSLLDREAAASYAVTVRATSADGSTADASFTISLTDVDEFDVSAMSDANGAANGVAENAASGTAVGLTAFAADADATTNTIVYTLTDDAGGRFAIDGTTGLVTVADGSLLDREAAASYAVTVRATSADGSTADASFTISLTDVDEFDVSAMSDANGAANGVAENAANGTAVGLTAFAADADATANTIVYTLTDDAGGRFAINGTTGLVTVADGSLLDRETAASYTMTVRATSADGSTADASFTINLTDVDEFDVSAPADANGATNGVAENAASGTAVGLTAFAADADATTNTIVYTLTDDAGGRFAIDGTTGLVTVADGSLLDREAAASYAVTVRATSADGSTADATFTINLSDVDESGASLIVIGIIPSSDDSSRSEFTFSHTSSLGASPLASPGLASLTYSSAAAVHTIAGAPSHFAPFRRTMLAADHYGSVSGANWFNDPTSLAAKSSRAVEASTYAIVANDEKAPISEPKDSLTQSDTTEPEPRVDVTHQQLYAVILCVIGLGGVLYGFRATSLGTFQIVLFAGWSDSENKEIHDDSGHPR